MTSLPYTTHHHSHTHWNEEEGASKSDVAHFDGLLGIWPSTPPTPSDDLQQLLGSSIFGASVTEAEAMVVLLDAMLMMMGVVVWRLLSQLKAGYCLLPLPYIVCETTWYFNGHRFH